MANKRQIRYPQIGETFYFEACNLAKIHGTKYHFVGYLTDGTKNGLDILMVVKRWNKYAQRWNYEVWRKDIYQFVYYKYIKFNRERSKK